MKAKFLLVIIQLFFFWNSTSLICQTPQATIISPENDELDISISPEIIIQTNYPIDTASFRIEPFDIWHYTYPDSIFADTCSRDTIINY